MWHDNIDGAKWGQNMVDECHAMQVKEHWQYCPPSNTVLILMMFIWPWSHFLCKSNNVLLKKRMLRDNFQHSYNFWSWIQAAHIIRSTEKPKITLHILNHNGLNKKGLVKNICAACLFWNSKQSLHIKSMVN